MKTPLIPFDIDTNHPGNCYTVAVKIVLNDDNDEYLLCHGEVQAPDEVPEGHTATPGEYFDHAWVEKTTILTVLGNDYSFVTCIDKSNGIDMELPQGFYYNIGRVRNVHRYNRREAMKMLVTHEHYGPWHG